MQSICQACLNFLSLIIDMNNMPHEVFSRQKTFSFNHLAFYQSRAGPKLVKIQTIIESPGNKCQMKTLDWYGETAMLFVLTTMLLTKARCRDTP